MSFSSNMFTFWKLYKKWFNDLRLHTLSTVHQNTRCFSNDRKISMKIQTELSIWHLDEDGATLCPFMMDRVKGEPEVGVLEEIIEVAHVTSERQSKHCQNWIWHQSTFLIPPGEICLNSSPCTHTRTYISTKAQNRVIKNRMRIKSKRIK